MGEKRLKFWGWGWEGEGATQDEVAALKRFYGGLLDMRDFPDTPPPGETEFDLPAPRITPPGSLAAICRDDAHTRLVHAMGKSFPDAVHMFDRVAPNLPDVVAFPETEAQVAEVMTWAAETGAALIPFGGGSSVVGGVEGNVGDAYKGVELRLLGAIHLRFGLPAATPAIVKRKTKDADKISAFLEATELAGFEREEALRFFGRPQALPREVLALIEPQATEVAQGAFLRRFGELAER